MNLLNLVVIEGNVVEDLQINETSTGKKVSNFSIGHDRYNYKADGSFATEKNYVDIETWIQQEGLLAKIKKGTFVRVTGRLKMTEWRDKEGKTRKDLIVVASEIGVRESKGGNKPDQIGLDDGTLVDL